MSNSVHQKARLSSIVLCFALLTSCASAPPPRKPTVTEQINFDRAIGSELAHQMDPELSLKKDPAIQSYLARLGQSIADKNPELHIPEVKVFLVQDTHRKYASYALPGGRLYISSGMLKLTQFENEVAAILALELGHLNKEHVLDYLRRNPAGLRVSDATGMPGVLPLKTLSDPEDIDFFGNDGMFSFSAKQNDEAVQSAVSLMYNASYDPRGLTALLQAVSENPAYSPWDQAECSRLIEVARKAYSLMAPLRNPVVQTDAFELIRNRIQKL